MGFKIGICELYHPNIHGDDNDFVSSNFLTFQFFPIAGYFSDFETVKQLQFLLNQKWNQIHSQIDDTYNQHPVVRNSYKINSDKGIIKPHIVQEVILDTGHSTCIIKTFWLRIFQRKWKNYYRKKINHYKKISSLNYRRMYGKWPKN
jgi:hypothetical protein